MQREKRAVYLLLDPESRAPLYAFSTDEGMITYNRRLALAKGTETLENLTGEGYCYEVVLELDPEFEND